MADETPDIPTEETDDAATEEMAEAAEAVAAEDANTAESEAPEAEVEGAEAEDADAGAETAEAAADAEDSAEAAEEAPAEEAESAGKFASAADPEADLPEAVQSAPEETQQQYQAVAAKGNSLKLAGDQVLSSDSKEDLKQSLPAAIVLKKNISKDVGHLYEQYKNLKGSNDDPDAIEQFKEACNTVIRDAQKVHQEIKEKVYSVYEKTPPS